MLAPFAMSFATLMLMLMLIAIMVAAVLAAVIAIVIATMLLAVTGRIFVLIPAILDKIHLLSTRIIRATMLRPMFGVAGWHPQVNRLPLDIAHRALNDDGFRIDHLRPGKLADIDAAIEARLADIDRYADIGGHCR